MNQPTTEQDASSARRSVLAWLGAAVVMLLTVGIVAVAGGFRTAVAQDAELPRLTFGEQHVNDRFSITVTDALVGKEVEGVTAFLDDNESLLVLTVQVTNLSEKAFQAEEALEDTLVIPSVGDEYMRVSRDNEDGSPWLQPEIPTELRVAWPVLDGVIQADQQIELELSDPQRYELSQLGTGTSWNLVVPSAIVVGTVQRADGGDQE